MENAPWVDVARSYLGVKEAPGLANNNVVVNFFKRIKRGGIKDDSVPWCAAFVGGCLEEAGFVSSRFESAKSYLSWGRDISTPVYGCIVIFSRTGGGHVGFCVGIDQHGRLLVLGVNQNDQVSIAPFNWNRVVGFRLPKNAGFDLPPLPLIDSVAPVSSNEG
jgi:uncharacterized protein (TIGR02594 family)